MEFALQYVIWELLRHKKVLETHVLPTLITENAWLFNEKKIIEYQVSTSYFRNFRFMGVCVAQV